MRDPADARQTVVDASAIVDFLLCPDLSSGLARVLSSQTTALHAPSLCDIEVAAGLRRAWLNGHLPTAQSLKTRLARFLELPLERYEHTLLLSRILNLRENFSVYDASYVALAEALGAPLLTSDARLAAAARAHTDVEILAA